MEVDWTFRAHVGSQDVVLKVLDGFFTCHSLPFHFGKHFFNIQYGHRRSPASFAHPHNAILKPSRVNDDFKRLINPLQDPIG